MTDIKNFKPQRSSRFKQGYIDPRTCKKLFESCQGKPIIYRSSWEKIFANWCESCKSVIRWGSECCSFKYYNPIDKKEHTYFPDFVLELVSGETIIVEIKPFAQTEAPGPFASDYEKMNYIRNKCKWRAVKEYVSTHEKMKFWIITEKSIHRLKY